MSAAAGPFFDELHRGQVFDWSPALTLTAGHAAAHQALVGDRLRLALEGDLSYRVLGSEAPLAHPSLVWDVAIGQSSIVTRRVIANLFYRGLVFHRFPRIGDTLSTTTEIVALRQNASKPGRPATGMAVLRIRTCDQESRPVLDFWRCPMLPLSDPDGQTGHDDDFRVVPEELPPERLDLAVRGWRLECFREATRADDELLPGQMWSVQGGDVVSGAPELARLTLNIAAVHHDATVTGRRLVYGGHTIGLAASQITRVFPNLVTIVAWHRCDHTGPVFEGDTLTTELELERLDQLETGGRLAHLRARVNASQADAPGGAVLDWRLVAVLA